MVVPNDEGIRHRILHDAHVSGTPNSGHLGCEKTYTSVARDFGGFACISGSGRMSRRAKLVNE